MGVLRISRGCIADQNNISSHAAAASAGMQGVYVKKSEHLVTPVLCGDQLKLASDKELAISSIHEVDEVLYSRSNKLVFVHIQKTGGSSVRKILVPRLFDHEELGFKHDLSKWHYQEFPEWNDCYKFCFVRNPWDRLVSWYSMIIQNRELLKQSRNKLWEYVIAESKNFEEFVRKCTGEIPDFDGTKSFAYNQFDYISDENGKILVDFVGRYENFSGDMRHVAHTLGIEEDVVPVHENRSKHRHYSSYYSEELKAIVADRYARDIEFFGYEFEYAPREVDQY